MKKIIFCLCILCIISCKPTDKQSETVPVSEPVKAESFDNKWFDGTWFYGWDLSTLFNLELHVEDGNKVKGKICSYADDGDYVDCSNDDFNLKGIIEGDSIRARFYSVHSPDKEGQAVIRKISEERVRWEITQAPQGEYKILNQVTLRKLD